MAKKKKTYNVIGQVVCVLRTKWSTSIGLTAVTEIKATTTAGALRAAKRVWRERGEWPVAALRRKAACTIHPSVEEV